MRITFLGNFRVDFTTESHWAATYEDLGHEVIRLQETEATARDLLREGMRSDFVHYVHTHGWETPDAELTPLIGNSLLDAFERLREVGIPTISVHLDIMRHLKRERDVFTEPFWKTEFVFTADGGSHQWYRDHGINHFYLPAGVFKRECQLGKHRPEYAHDVVFVGARYGYHSEWPYRPRLISWLEETYGDRFALYGRDGKGTIRGEDLNDLYASAKVIVGDTLCHGFNHPHYFSDRLFETTGRGGFLIFPFITGINELFNVIPSGDAGQQELVTYQFENFDELKKTIDEALEDADWRQAVRIAGHERTLRDHTYDNRARRVIETLKAQGALK